MFSLNPPRGCRLVWSRLVDFGSINPGSNPGSPTTFGFRTLILQAERNHSKLCGTRIRILRLIGILATEKSLLMWLDDARCTEWILKQELTQKQYNRQDTVCLCNQHYPLWIM